MAGAALQALSTRYHAFQRPHGNSRVLPHELRDLVVTATRFSVALWHGPYWTSQEGLLLEPFLSL